MRNNKVSALCELCDNNSESFDKDMLMWLCRNCFASFNGEVVDIELNEVW